MYLRFLDPASLAQVGLTQGPQTDDSTTLPSNASRGGRGNLSHNGSRGAESHLAPASSLKPIIQKSGA